MDAPQDDAQRVAVGAQIRLGRRRFRWTQVDLAGQIGVSQSMISLLENGRSNWPAGAAFRPDVALLRSVVSELGLPERFYRTACAAWGQDPGPADDNDVSAQRPGSDESRAVVQQMYRLTQENARLVDEVARALSSSARR